MTTRAGRISLLALALLVACAFDVTGDGKTTSGGGDASTGEETSGDATGTESTTTVATSTTDGASTTSDPSGSTTTADPSASTTQSGSTGPAASMVAFDEATYAFGNVTFSDTAELTLTLTNSGGAEATDLVAGGLPIGFAYPTDAFPGGGTCGTTLDGGESCTVIVSFPARALGPRSGTFDVDYTGTDGPGTASTDLTAAAVGTTGNLLVNPGGEMVGNPPPGWTDVLGEFAWSTIEGTARSGTHSIYGGDVGGANGDQALDQRVDLSAHAAAIDDAAGVRVDFVGYGQSLFGFDEYAFQLLLYDGAGDDNFFEGTPYQNDTSWDLNQFVTTAQSGTREARVILFCERDDGEECNGYFDDMALTLTYPAP